MILGDNYTTYNEALEICSLDTLRNRRNKLCLDFATKIVKNPLCSDWIPVTQNVNYSLRKRPRYRQFNCKTKRFQSSAIPYLIQLLNE